MNKKIRPLLVVLGAAVATSSGYFAWSVFPRAGVPADRTVGGWREPDPGEVEASRRCVAELERHDPEVDADRDFARGDTTPIGATSVPHDPPEPSTRYEAACEKSYADAYRPTGKWFTYTLSGFTFAPRSNDYQQCQGAAGRYIARYNRRMATRAPDAVRRFCAAQKLDDSSRRVLATEAVFGAMIRKNGYVDGAIVDAALGGAYLTKPDWLIDTELGPVLITKSRKAGPSAACLEGCAETIGFVYLTEKDQRMTVKRRWPLVHRTNEDGWQGGTISCCEAKRRTLHPELTVQEAMVRKGCRMYRETLIELTPQGPMVRGAIPIALDAPPTARPESLARFGTVENVVRGRSFDIVVPHPRIVEHYQLRRGQFVGPAKSALTC